MDHTDGGLAVPLKRSLGLPLTVLYGLGITIGAGIYVLVGTAAARAGFQAPLAFILAALVMAPSGAAFAELASRLPMSAGEAAYVKEGFGSDRLALLVGWMVAAIGVVSAAAIGRGAAGYIRELMELPLDLIVVLVVLAMGAVAAWGIVESVALAGAITLIEIGGLLILIVVAAVTVPDLGSRLPEAWPGLTNAGAWAGVLSASLIAFFAFTGFEGIANIAEEVKSPGWTIPRAILITLALTTLLYVLVVWVTLNVIPHDELGTEGAPLSRVFERMTGASPLAFSTIAILATINGVVFYLILSSRVLYGLARRGLLPARLGEVNPTTRTPLLATGLVVAVTLVLALAFPIEELAEMTSRLTLLVFALVNAALIAIKRRGLPPPPNAYVTPGWVPVAGLFTSVCLLASEALS
ncbi:APC family permease [Hyphomicrobium sp.]|uniref:APC family permease n=1 Tax=Hyphomicrobium sp. TaxID=82 RepID=UPI0025B90E63|nr:APC family permease [Hyphomicrobium sp.]MCC7250558.1 amino acid permease [Hyphomicrobium sp.]